MALLDFFRRRPEASPEALGHFLHGQAAYVAQKTVLDYCRVKAGRSEKQLFADPDFQAALQHCRWQVFFSALTDVTALIEAHLRPHAPGREGQLAAALAPLHAAALVSEPPPAEEAPSAEAARDTLPHHLAKLQAEPALPAHRLPLLAEPVLFATLPIHAEQRQGESLAIKGALRFQIVSTQQEFERRFDAAQTARNLLKSR
ncbi:hypothetical protein KTR66_15920 [Roseococcus sp. SDR]|uniref:hypothetical protein n=1 Tax=Roseococcus sp. SDR TaxID=2835532 RepID=UPI001BCF7E87|nr:hypothetical protein [Roseococcus sp. SDR]MBS7791490.1 hypothetical protein [Roseococcus sp. SDR]MBV1846804.1 hypothetical protein [Roseococcus sp. SDR]